MERLLAVAVPFFAPILVGYLAGRAIRRPDDGLTWLNFFVIYVALPPVFYQVVSKTPFSQLTSFLFVFGTMLSSYIAFTLSFAIAWITLKGSLKDAALAGGVGGFGNVGYMGPGIALAAFGPQAAAPMALIFCFDAMLFFTLIPLLAALGEDHADLRGTARVILRRVALNPFIIATALGFIAAFLEFRPPEAIDRTLDFLRVAAAPAALFALGVTVSLRPAGRLPSETVAALIVKLIVHPIVVYLILSVLGTFDPIWVYTAILLAALPPAITIFVLAAQFQTYTDRASTAVLVGTFLSVPTLLLWLYLIDQKVIPPDLFPN